MDTSSGSPLNHPVDPYYAYPTRSSFLLGEWYWNDGVKKSQSSFRNLLKIVGNADFRPQDVAGVNWRLIDAQLGGDSRGDGEDNWEDERDDRDWIETLINIMVPFHK